MILRSATWSALLLVLLAGCKATPRPSETRTPQPPRLQFVEQILGGASPNVPLPTIIAMHGLGDRPERFAQLFQGYDRPVRLILVRGPDDYGSGARWFATRVGDDRPEALAQGMTKAAIQVAHLIDGLQRAGRISGRPTVTGFSQGGMVTLALAVQHPDILGQAIAIGGWLPPPLWPEPGPARDGPPIIALHGQADRIVPFAPAQAAITALAERGRPARMIPFPGLGHSISGPLRAQFFALLDEGLGVESRTRAIAP